MTAKHPGLIVMRKEIRLLFKSKRRVMLLSVMPIVILLSVLIAAVASNFATANVDPTNVWVVDNDNSGNSTQLIALWSTINDTKVDIKQDYQQLLDAKEYDILILIPANFSTLLEQEQLASIYLSYNNNETSHQIVASTIIQQTLAYEDYLIRTENPNVQFDRIGIVLQQVEEQNQGIPEEAAGALLLIPVYIIVFVVIPPLSLIMISVTLEREQRTLETLFLQPVKRRAIVLGKIYYGLALIGLSILLDGITIVISIFLFKLISKGGGGMNDPELDSIFKSLSDVISTEALIMFAVSIMIVAFNVIALSVLLSLLAKDEKEANMISGIIPLLLFGVVAIVFVVPVADMPVFSQFLLSAFPLLGIFIAIFLSTLAGSVIPMAWISAVIQLLWGILIVWGTAKISEAESIIELTWGKAIRELMRNLAFWKR